MEENNYEVKGITTSIKFTSRASVKIKDNFYTIEACEERIIPDLEDVDVEQERKALWDCVNDQVDEQTEVILQTFKSRN